MKLYATVTSERASKGQGGQYIEIEVMDSNRVPRLNIKIQGTGEYQDGCEVAQIYLSGAIRLSRSFYLPLESKSKKQKGDKLCNHGINLEKDNCWMCHN